MSAMNLARIEATTGIRQRNAPLPINYERAVAALKECADVDELISWSNNAEAAAGYYKTWKDKEGEYQMRRIKTRAVVRLGEVLKEISAVASWNGREYKSPRTQLLQKIGMSHAASNLAVRASTTPPRDRERMIERSPPATVKQIAAVSPITINNLRSRSHKNSAQWRDMMSQPGSLSRFLGWCRANEPKETAQCLSIDQREMFQLKDMLREIENWTYEFERNLKVQQ
jgi:hypothetical protein